MTETTQQLVDKYRAYAIARRVCAGYEGGDHARMVVEVQEAHIEIARLRLDLENARAERDRKAAALARVLAECDATWAAADGWDEDDEAQRELITRIRAAIEGPTQ